MTANQLADQCVASLRLGNLIIFVSIFLSLQKMKIVVESKSAVITLKRLLHELAVKKKRQRLVTSQAILQTANWSIYLWKEFKHGMDVTFFSLNHRRRLEERDFLCVCSCPHLQKHLGSEVRSIYTTNVQGEQLSYGTIFRFEQVYCMIKNYLVFSLPEPRAYFNHSSLFDRCKKS